MEKERLMMKKKYRQTLTFLSKMFKAALRTLRDFVVRTAKNAPATTVMVLAVCGLTNILIRMPIEVALAPVWFISEAMFVPVLSVMIIFTLAYIAGVSNGKEFQCQSI